MLYFEPRTESSVLERTTRSRPNPRELNSAVESLLRQAEPSSAPTVRLDINGRRVLAARIERTGWLVILMEPQTPSS